MPGQQSGCIDRSRNNRCAGICRIGRGVERRVGSADIAENRRADVAQGQLPGGIHLQPALPLVAVIGSTVCSLGVRRGGSGVAGKHVIAKTVLGIGKAEQIVQAALQLRRIGSPVARRQGTAAGCDDQSFGILQQRGHAGQRAFGSIQAAFDRVAIGGKMIIDGIGLGNDQRTRRTDRIVTRIEYPAIRRYLLLRPVQATL